MDAMAKARHSAGKLAFGGKIKRTLCGLCPAHCGMLVEVKDGRPVRFHGDPDNPVNLTKPIFTRNLAVRR